MGSGTDIFDEHVKSIFEDENLDEEKSSELEDSGVGDLMLRRDARR
jgi:hypothetical protein